MGEKEEEEEGKVIRFMALAVKAISPPSSSSSSSSSSLTFHTVGQGEGRRTMKKRAPNLKINTHPSLGKGGEGGGKGSFRGYKIIVSGRGLQIFPFLGGGGAAFFHVPVRRGGGNAARGNF